MKWLSGSISLSREGKCLIVLALVAITVLLYANSLGHGFVFDDELLINDQGYILKDIKNVFASAGSLVFQDKTSASFYRPVLVLSYFVDYQLGGGGAFAFHLSNLLFHLIAVLLVFYAAFLIFKDTLSAFLAALFFSVHPAQAEAVAWVSGRNDPLMLFFVLLSFIFFMKYREKDGRAMLWASGLAFFLALFTKESALISPLLFFGYDLFYTARQKERRNRSELFKPYIAFTAFIFLYVIIRLMFVKGGSGQPGGITAMPLIYFFYLKTIVLPAGFSVVPLVKTQLSAFDYFIRSLPLFILIWLIFYARKKMPLVSFGLWWGLLALLPVSGMISMPVLAMEHRLYGAMFGFSLVFGAISEYLLRRYSKYSSGIILVLVVILGLFGWMSFQRSRLFSSPLVLWETSARNNSSSDLIYTNLAAAEIKLHNYQLAERQLKKALQIRYSNEIAHYNLGYLYLLTGRKKMAKEEFEKAVGLDPKYIKAHYNLGIIALNDRDNRAAISEMKTILMLKPGYLPALGTLGDAYYNLREDGRARAYYKEVLKLDPENSHAREMVGKLKLE